MAHTKHKTDPLIIFILIHIVSTCFPFLIVLTFLLAVVKTKKRIFVFLDSEFLIIVPVLKYFKISSCNALKTTSTPF